MEGSSSSERPLVTAEMIKRFFYCPRMIYMDEVLGARKLRFTKLEEGRERHERLQELDERRKGGLFYSGELGEARKIFGIYLRSERLGLAGRLDLLLVTDRELIPVEYKARKGKRARGTSIPRDHKYQLIAYALMLEDQFEKPVRRGFIYYEEEDEVVELRITPEARRFLERKLEEIREILELERIPEPTRIRAKCRECEYSRFCGGV